MQCTRTITGITIWNYLPFRASVHCFSKPISIADMAVSDCLLLFWTVLYVLVNLCIFVCNKKIKANVFGLTHNYHTVESKFSTTRYVIQYLSRSFHDRETYVEQGKHFNTTLQTWSPVFMTWQVTTSSGTIYVCFGARNKICKGGERGTDRVLGCLMQLQTGFDQSGWALYCWLLTVTLLLDIPAMNNGNVQIQSRAGPFHKFKVTRYYVVVVHLTWLSSHQTSKDGCSQSKSLLCTRNWGRGGGSIAHWSSVWTMNVTLF